MQKTGNLENDIKENVQRLTLIFQNHIAKYPKEYLWTYKIWKYSQEKNILILNDGKHGHLRQSQALAKIIADYLKDKGINASISTGDVIFKNKFSRYGLIFSSCFAGRYICQGCLWCLKKFLKPDSYKSLTGIKPDIVISSGSVLAGVNFIISRENLAKSMVIMRPSIFSTRRFDLVVMPKHDRPPKRKNVVITKGALNLISEDYLASCIFKLKSQVKTGKELILGLLVGGDSRGFRLDRDSLREIIAKIKEALEELDGEILVTTSRRTSFEIEHLLKEEFKNYPRCKFLIIANEENFPFALGGILGLSKIILVSPESISMISEAAKSGKYVLTFDSPGLGKRHKFFLKYFAKNKYIYLVKPSDLSQFIKNIWLNKPKIRYLEDEALIREALKKIL